MVLNVSEKEASSTVKTIKAGNNRQEMDDLFGKDYFQGAVLSEYESYEQNGVRMQLDLVNAIINILGKEHKIESAFDAGCAMGFLVKAFRVQGIEASGCDISKYAIDKGKTLLNLELICAQLADLPVTEPADIVVCLETLEHVQRTSLNCSIQGLIRQTRKWILITVPDMERHTPEMFYDGDQTHSIYAPRRLWLKWILKAGRDMNVPLLLRYDIMGEFNRLTISRRRWKYAMIFDRDYPHGDRRQSFIVMPKTVERLKWAVSDIVFAMKKIAYKILIFLRIKC